LWQGAAAARWREIERAVPSVTHFIVDTGASAFVAVNRYALRMDLPGLIHAAGKTMVINMMLVAGNTLFETLANLEAMAAQMPPQVHIVVWINPHFGRVEDERGRSFEQMECCQLDAARLRAVHLITR
jgi:hypothetical protein